MFVLVEHVGKAFLQDKESPRSTTQSSSIAVCDGVFSNRTHVFLKAHDSGAMSFIYYLKFSRHSQANQPQGIGQSHNLSHDVYKETTCDYLLSALPKAGLRVGSDWA